MKTKPATSLASKAVRLPRNVVSTIRRRPVEIGVAFLLVLAMAVSTIAAGMGAKKVTLTNENPSATSVGYTFSLNPATTGTPIERIEIQVGTTQGGSTVPTGMVTTGAAVGTIGGLTGTWTGTFTTNGLLSIANAAGSTPTNPISLQFTGITNSSATGTYYFRITTFDADTGGSQIDQADVAFPIANSTTTVSASVGETLSFALNTTSVALGTLSTGSVASNTNTMTVATNAASGFVITGQGSTLTAGALTIPFTTDGTVTAGVSEYGIAFSGGAGSHPSGDQDLSSTTTVTTVTGPVSSDVTTATYKASITGSQGAGDYTSSITYICTATF